MEFLSGSDHWGSHRVVKPTGCLPQAAQQLDASLPIYDTEILISVSSLQIDSASFHQLAKECSNQNLAEELKQKILDIVQTRGKMHNPITNSGGVLLGEVIAIGPAHPLAGQIKAGDTITTLVSLTLTPLSIQRIHSIDLAKERVAIDGHAILFGSGMLATMPGDFSEGVALAAFDVCGAPAQTKRLVKAGDQVFVVGLGKAGRTIVCQANAIGASVCGIDANEQAVAWCQQNCQGQFAALNAQDPIAVRKWLEANSQLADVSFHATNVDNSEMTTIMATRPGGQTLFFGMHTSFQKAVLGAEGVAQDVSLLMGSGYVPGHAETTLELLREHEALRQWFEDNYS